jgi:DNA modification methylase
VDAVVTDPPYGVNLGKHGAAKDRRANRVLVKDGYASYEDTPENFDRVVVVAIEQCLQIADRAAVFCAFPSAYRLPPADAVGGVFIPNGCGRSKWGFTCLGHCLLYGQAPDLHLGARPTSVRLTDTAEKNGHPCPKPLSWMRWAIELATRPGDTVFDPFMGSGTTGVACMQTGRKFIGIEIDPGYFEIARKRIEAAVPLQEAAT